MKLKLFLTTIILAITASVATFANAKPEANIYYPFEIVNHSKDALTVSFDNSSNAIFSLPSHISSNTIGVPFLVESNNLYPNTQYQMQSDISISDPAKNIQCVYNITGKSDPTPNPITVIKSGSNSHHCSVYNSGGSSFLIINK